MFDEQQEHYKLGFITSRGELFESAFSLTIAKAVAIRLMKQLNTAERRGKYSVRYVVVKL